MDWLFITFFRHIYQNVDYFIEISLFFCYNHIKVKRRDDMKKTSGQALVEFIMILPVFLLLVFATIDFGTIIYEKYRLQNDLDVIKELYEQDQEGQISHYISDHKLSLMYEDSEYYTTIIVSKKIDIVTPGLNRVLDNPYTVEESVTILRETE